MKKLLLLLVLPFVFISHLKAQDKPGPAEQKLLDSLCNSMNRLDLSKITTPEQANDAFMSCFLNYADLLTDVAEELGLNFTDDAAGEKVGELIGKELMKQKCGAFLKLAAILAKKGDTPVALTTTGTFKRIDNKGFNYIVLTDSNGNEKSFLWLRQFPGSEKFIAPTALTGKKLTITWQEMEVYLPQAKGYYKVKEITAADTQ
ncbi:type 2 periplasmic-binding domain-containing protein [Mucilaginibacter segetis]|uniref:Uncharacterized protein n=1 Tax=Mucilaginibacter segetis TaxID=2793071 RepID=A0A934UNP1_9SPHI|nr:hypothetical protein [Mucilaginibacter segetis]MBK0380619.1 hypothetical protein [Mucilaginibacter segetis]